MKTKLLTIATMVALMLGTMTMVQAQAPCLPQMHGLEEHQSASCGVTQLFALTTGWNWISSYIEMDDPIELLLMIESGLDGNGTVIKNADYTTSYEDEEWFGDLDDEGIMNEQMYKIYVTADCEFELQGTPANPANHTITIVHGWNWIGFPYSQTVSIEDALADFEAEEGDILKTSESTTNFEDGEWFGDIEEMIPGQGYMYYSNSNDEKELTFQTGAKAHRAYPNFGQLPKQSFKVMPVEGN